MNHKLFAYYAVLGTGAALQVQAYGKLSVSAPSTISTIFLATSVLVTFLLGAGLFFRLRGNHVWAECLESLAAAGLLTGLCFYFFAPPAINNCPVPESNF